MKKITLWVLTYITLTALVACFGQVASPPPAEKSKGEDKISVEEKRAKIEHIFRKPVWTIYKYRNAKERRRLRPYQVVLFKGNMMLNEGIDEIWNLVSGSGGTAYNNANARCGVGDSAVAEAATQTDLQAGVNKLYKAQNASFPTTGTQKITFQCDFTGAEANFAWNEFTVDNGGTALKNLNRKVSAQGTKTSGQVWTLLLEIALS